MLRKLVVILLTGVFCLLGITSALAVTYNEAPMFRTMVAAGELPPVEERLPEEPLVVVPVEEIGQYGGTLKIGHVLLTRSLDMMTLNGSEIILKFSLKDLATVVPNVAKGYEMSSDAKILTVYLRKGMKWSDGYPFTVDDVLFWWEDYTSNKEISPRVPKEFCPGGEVAKFEKVDDYTFRFHFAAPNPLIASHLAKDGNGRIFLPKHYFKQFHPKYTSKEELAEIMKEEGVESWFGLFSRKMRGYGYGSVPGKSAPPDINAYMLKETKGETNIYERNPYYWKVDTEGNQLPYIDGVQDTYFSPEVLEMKIMAGEVDFAWSQPELINFPLYKENEEKGGYKVLKWYDAGTKFSFFPNQNCKDLVLQKIIQDRRFRIAISLTIDREKINEVVFYGLGTPMQHTVLPPSRISPKEFTEAYIEYNPEEANRLLDEMGLKWDKNHQWRLRPDGEVLSLAVMITPEYRSMGIPQCEIIKINWKQIGVELIIDQVTMELYNERMYASEHEMGMWMNAPAFEGEFYISPRDYIPIQIGWTQWAPEWARWYVTDGEEGDEPPQEIKRLYKVYERMKITVDEGERVKLAKEILKSQAENLWAIATIGQQIKPAIVNEDLRNLPEKPVWRWTFGVGWLWNTCQWFYEK